MGELYPDPELEPRGCPTPGCCSAVEEIRRLRSMANAPQEDLHAICRALGIPDIARPISCHQVVHTMVIPKINDLRAELATMADLMRECLAAVEHEDPRMDYVTVQVSKAARDEARELIAKWLPRWLPMEDRDG